jgi:hypothetical protein
MAEARNEECFVSGRRASGGEESSGKERGGNGTAGRRDRRRQESKMSEMPKCAKMKMKARRCGVMREVERGQRGRGKERVV